MPLVKGESTKQQKLHFPASHVLWKQMSPSQSWAHCNLINLPRMCVSPHPSAWDTRAPRLAWVMWSSTEGNRDEGWWYSMQVSADGYS